MNFKRKRPSLKKIWECKKCKKRRKLLKQNIKKRKQKKNGRYKYVREVGIKLKRVYKTAQISNMTGNNKSEMINR